MFLTLEMDRLSNDQMQHCHSELNETELLKAIKSFGKTRRLVMMV